MADGSSVMPLTAAVASEAAPQFDTASITVPRVPPLLLQAPLPPAPPVRASFDSVQRQLIAYYTSVRRFLDDRVAEATAEAALDALEFALWVFNCQNFTGDISKGEVASSRDLAMLLDRASYADDPIAQREARKYLISDGEVPSPVVRAVPLLLFSLALVHVAPEVVPVTSIWRLRVLFRHQLCLAHRSHTLLMEIAKTIDAVGLDPVLGADPLNLVEIAHVQSYYCRFDEAGNALFRAVELSKLELKESSMLGVRTRWQKIQFMQSLLIAKSQLHFDAATAIPQDVSALPPPTTIQGYDQGHDLYDRPRADTQSGDTEDVTMLHPTDKSLLLALCHNIRNTNPSHGLTAHKIQVYIERLMVDPGPLIWCLHAMQLLVRARLEQRRNRVQERAFLQLQQLVDQFALNEKNIPTMPRCHPKFFYSIAFPSIWELRQEFAGWCVEDNLFKTALEIYEQIQDWPNIIECCSRLDRRKKAENLARDLLKEDPGNPTLLVALGEATREDAYLWEAWEASGRKMAAPMRSLAKLALEREHYEKVVEYFDIAVKINPIFGGDWFALGFASMQLGNLERACEAFTRVCMMDPNNAFAWNNLGSVMMRRGQFRPAFNALSQALRNNRRSWRMWYNYFTLGVELLEVTETTHALSIVLDIAQRECTLEGVAMHKFVTNAIRFIKGEIGATPDTDSADQTWIKHHKHGKLVESDAPGNGDGDAVGEACASTGTEAEELEFAGELLPLGHDVEMPESFFPAKDAARRQEQEEVQRGIVKRYVERLRKLFRQITDNFVQDVEVWAAYATLVRFLDGPKAAYELRLKEVRTSQQVEQWERKPEPFARAVQALEAASNDARECATAPAEGSEADFEPLRYTVQQIDAALQIAAEHMNSDPNYRQLQVLRLKVSKEAAKGGKKRGVP